MGPDLPRRRFSTAEYHRMLEAGILFSGERLELLAGEIFEAASIGSRHAACVTRLARQFERRIGERVLVRVQSPIELSERSEPEPDLALVAWRDDFYAEAHPRPQEVLLVVEVSDTSYGGDLDRKVPLYAEAGIRELWIVDLEARRVEIRLEPAGRRYTRLERRGRGEGLAPERLPEAALAVDDLLP